MLLSPLSKVAKAQRRAIEKKVALEIYELSVPGRKRVHGKIKKVIDEKKAICLAVVN